MNTSVTPNPRVTFRVHHEDDDLLVIEKPTRIVTQPGIGHDHDTLLNGLFATHESKLRRLGVARDHGLVHRLDRETSGLVAVALSQRAYDGLRKQFERREVRKFYWAITGKAPKEPAGVVRRPILELVRRTDKYTTRKISRVSTSGKSALTAYRTIQASEIGALVEARPVTGRLHQVRVHMALIGAAIVGDELYGAKRLAGAAPRLALHAHRLAFAHPVTGEPVDVRSHFPKDLRQTLRLHELDLPDPDGPSAGKDE